MYAFSQFPMMVYTRDVKLGSDNDVGHSFSEIMLFMSSCVLLPWQDSKAYIQPTMLNMILSLIVCQAFEVEQLQHNNTRLMVKNIP